MPIHASPASGTVAVSERERQLGNPRPAAAPGIFLTTSHRIVHYRTLRAKMQNPVSPLTISFNFNVLRGLPTEG